MKKNNKSAFTLAELMIVLTIIGVLAGILLPIANTSRPDKAVMLFKKSHATLGTVIRELVTSDKYFGSDFSKKPNDADWANAPKYFCQCFADIVSSKEVSCSEAVVSDYKYVEITNSMSADDLLTKKKRFDTACRSNKSVGPEIKTADGVVWYQSAPAYDFANSAFGKTDDDGFLKNYKIMCFDVDGIDNGELPFGYGIRRDGKIVTGKYADDWLQKSMQKGRGDN